MASHLSVTSAISGGLAVAKGLNGQASASAEGESAPSTLMDVFAALLSGATAAAPAVAGAATRASEASIDYKMGNLVDLSLDFGSDTEGSAPDPEILAAVVNAIVPIQANEPVAVTAELTAIVDGLASIKASIEAGKPLDPQLLKRVDAELNQLAAKLDIDLEDLPTLADLTALLAKTPPASGSAEARLTDALEPFARSMLTGEATAAASDDMELPALVKSIGDKVAALVQAINTGKVQLPVPAATADIKATLEPELEAALLRLTTPPKIEAAVSDVVLATPQLDLTEPVLTGKARASLKAGKPDIDAPMAEAKVSSKAPDAAPQAAVATKATAEPTAVPDDKKVDLAAGVTADAVAPVRDEPKIVADTGNEPRTEAKVEAKATAAPVAAAADQITDPQASTLTVQQASRIDVSSAPRVVQAGYQTSQQQLNLPQLAFEVARQANDGNTRFQIRLDPAELGKIDVRLDIDSTGQVNARLTVEKPETLDMMQRDQRSLERALQQAGLDTSKTNLEFSLKQNPFGAGSQQHGQDGQGRQPAYLSAQGNAEADEAPAPTVSLYRGSLTANGVNIIA